MTIEEEVKFCMDWAKKHGLSVEDYYPHIWNLVRICESNFRETKEITWLIEQFTLFYGYIKFDEFDGSRVPGQAALVYDAYVVWKRICEIDESEDGKLQDDERFRYELPDSDGVTVDPLDEIRQYWFERLPTSNPARDKFRMDDIYRLRKEYNFDYFLRDDGKNYDGEVEKRLD